LIPEHKLFVTLAVIATIFVYGASINFDSITWFTLAAVATWLWFKVFGQTDWVPKRGDDLVKICLMMGLTVLAGVIISYLSWFISPLAIAAGAGWYFLLRAVFWQPRQVITSDRYS
jgi:hypothetical protein